MIGAPAVWVVLATSVALFVLLLRALHLAPLAALVVSNSRRAAKTLVSKVLDEDEKEARVRRLSGLMARSFVSIALRSAVCVIAPATLVLAGAWIGIYPLSEAIATASGVPFIAAASVATVALWMIASRFSARKGALR